MHDRFTLEKKDHYPCYPYKDRQHHTNPFYPHGIVPLVLSYHADWFKEMSIKDQLPMAIDKNKRGIDQINPSGGWKNESERSTG
jgi:hypothetical protein